MFLLRRTALCGLQSDRRERQEGEIRVESWYH